MQRGLERCVLCRAWNPNEPLEDLKQRLLQDLQVGLGGFNYLNL